MTDKAPKPRVLVTGSGGLIGSMLIRSLGDRYNFHGLTRTRRDGMADVPTVIANASDFDAIRPVFDGMDAVVHMAANPTGRAPWESVLQDNLVATRNVYEAARQAGARRLLFASSNHTVGLFENDEPYRRIVRGDYSGLDPANVPQVDHTVPPRPDSYYGISKVYGEAIGRYYAEEYGMEVACLRIGTVNRRNDPTGNVRHMATWLSHRDLAQMVDQCLSVSGLKFEVFYGVSGNRWRFWDISHAGQVLGYSPQDDAEQYRDRLSSG